MNTGTPDKFLSPDKLITRDWLAIERTRMSNERTFLAYFRTAVVLLASGLSIVKIEFFSDIRTLGIFLATLAPLVLLIGIFRLILTSRTIRKYYNNGEARLFRKSVRQ